MSSNDKDGHAFRIHCEIARMKCISRSIKRTCDPLMDSLLFQRFPLSDPSVAFHFEYMPENAICAHTSYLIKGQTGEVQQKVPVRTIFEADREIKTHINK